MYRLVQKKQHDMKSHSGNLSCSCTSCTYKSESDRPSFRNFIAQGSRIDRLYYGKYIPLRERKLLERLVRTRGVYDDIRTQLLSDSTISLDKKTVLKPPKKIDDNLKTRAIIELVGQVDKGEKLEPKELSGCCSCCSCYSKANSYHKPLSKQIHSNHTREKRKAKVRFKAKHIRSDPCTCTYKFSGIIKNLSNKYRANPSFFPMDMQPTTDEEISQRPLRIKNSARLSYEKLEQSAMPANNMMMEGVRKINESKTKILGKVYLQAKKSLDVLSKVKNKSNVKIKGQDKSPAFKKKSNTLLCTCPETNLISQIKKDSILKFRNDLKRKRRMKDWECDSVCYEDICVPEECFYKLQRKNSQLFKGYKPIFGNTKIKNKDVKTSKKYPSIKVRSKEMNQIIIPKEILNPKPLLRSQILPEIRTHVKKGKTKAKQDLKTQICQCKSTLSLKRKDIKSGTNLPITVIPKKKRTLNQPVPKIVLSKKGKIIKPDPKESVRQAVRIGSSFSFNIEFYKTKNLTSKEKIPHLQKLNIYGQPSHSKYSIDKIGDKNVYKQTSSYKTGSQTELKKLKRNIKTNENSIKRCFCTLKLKPEKNESKTKHQKEISVSKKSVTTLTTLNVKMMNVETNTYDSHAKKANKKKKKNTLLPYECEPGLCKPYNCDPYHCIKLIDMRNRLLQTGFSPINSETRKNKSTSRFSLRSYVTLKNKFFQPTHSIKGGIDNIKRLKKTKSKKKHTNKIKSSKNRQVVRIGSNMSFNIEFHQDKSPFKLHDDRIKTKVDQSNSSDGEKMAYKTKLTTRGIGKTLKRFFCTLKMKDKNKNNTKSKNNKKIITEQHLIDSKIFMTYDKSTKTKSGRKLKPHECEPGVCIPGACNPYFCLERINQRYNNLKEIGSITNSPETKNVSSITYSKKSLKNIYVQTKPKAINQNSFVIAKSKLRKDYSSSALNNQSVKISSTFSFNVEFSKTNKKPNKPLYKIKSTSSLRKNGKHHKTTGNKTYSLNVADMTTQVVDGKKIHKSSRASHIVKRCFCTLNLQKYRKHRPDQFYLPTPFNQRNNAPVEYTINRVLISTPSNMTNKRSTNLHDLSSRGLLCDYQNKIKLTKESCVPFQEITSSSYSLNIQQWSSKTNSSETKLISTSYLKRTEFTNINRYMKNCFCTMNLQLENKNISFRKPKRNSVKLGSSFSFNIDFLKNNRLIKNKTHKKKLYPSKYSPVKKITKSSIKSVGTANKKYSDSLGDAMPKRCCCTLKLHKKGKWHINQQKTLKPSNSVDQSKAMVKSVNKTQNTKFKSMNVAHSVTHSECKPNICTSGDCDPYRCLEIIKKRNNKNKKDFGIDTIFQLKKSDASMTQNTQVIKGTQEGSKQADDALISTNLKSSRQVVKVGSNISFNIEFYKVAQTPLSSHSTYKNEKVTKANDSSLCKPKKYYADTSQNKKVTQNKHTDMRKFPKIASTMTTSFLKRCFCTAQLQRFNQKDTINDVSSPSFLKKCFCLLKTMKHSKVAENGIHIKKNPHFNKKADTQNIITLGKSFLLCHKCEPVLCVPEMHDPYECCKILKRNKSKNSKISTAKKTRSVFTYNPSTETRNARIQSKTKYKLINKRPGPSDTFLKASDRQAVKIGSNFSFNIEFYKNKYPGDARNRKPLKYRSLTSNYEINNKKIKNKIKSDVVSTHSRFIQSVSFPKLDRATEGHYLKRCFCTLQLKGRHDHDSKIKTQKKVNYEDVKLRTKSIMTGQEKNDISSFECEPNTCVPYQCDPYECVKIIKLRDKKQYKATGISTQIPKKHSAVMTEALNRSKRKIQTVKSKNHKVNFYGSSKKLPTTQKIKIGSSFDFNISVFKDRNNVRPNLTDRIESPYKKLRKKSQQIYVDSTRNTRKHTHPRPGPKTRKESTISQPSGINITPILKKCFCTLFLKKSPEKKFPLKPVVLSKGAETQKQQKKEGLLPYECEPRICVPGECHPHECLELIKKRQLKNFAGDAMLLQTKNFANKAGIKTNQKHKTSQYKNRSLFSKHNNILKKIIATDGKQQAVRIGSIFNFDIEFYKNENGPSNKSKIDTTDFDEVKPSKFKVKKRRISECSLSICPELKKVNKHIVPSKQTQIKTLGDNNKQSFLKKCFCLLKLHKMRHKKVAGGKRASNKNKKNEIQRDLNKNIATRQHNLLPFECERNICVPGECDPYECEQQIKKRLQQNNEIFISKATITDTFKPKSIKLQASKVKLKERKQNTKLYLDKNLNKSFHKKSESRDTNWQAVRIGSTFSFDVEFFKGRKQKPFERDSKNERIKKIKYKNTSKHKSMHTGYKTMATRCSKDVLRICNPGKCDKKTNTSWRKTKSYNISTQVIKQCADECVGMMENEMCKTRNRSNITSDKRVTQFKNLTNRQPVKIGSNFSFNVEFYKSSSPKKQNNYNKKQLKSVKKIPEATVDDKTMNTSNALKQNHKSQAVIETGDKSFYVHNPLNRCFCTLKFHKNVNKPPLYPQTFEIRRLNVLQKVKSPPNKSLIPTVKTSVRTVATKIHKNYMNENVNTNRPWGCKNRHSYDTEIETILPFKPTKFKKTPSKSVLKIPNNQVTNSAKTMKIKKKVKNKKSRQNIYSKKPFILKRILCRCADAFTLKNKVDITRKNINNGSKSVNMKLDTRKHIRLRPDRLRESKSDRKSSYLNQCKSLDCKCYEKCALHCRAINKSKKQNFNINNINDKKSLENLGKKRTSKSGKKSIDINDKNKALTKREILYVSKIICSHCQKNLPENEIKEHLKVSTTRFSKKIDNKKSEELPEHCYSCGRLFIKEEIKKGSGDRPADHLNKEKVPPGHRITTDKIKSNAVCYGECKREPLFELQLNANDYDIINKNEVIGNVTKLSSKVTDDESLKHPNINVLKSKIKSMKNKQNSKTFEDRVETKSTVKNNKSTGKYNIMCELCRQKTKIRRNTPNLKVHFLESNFAEEAEHKLKNRILKKQKPPGMLPEDQKKCSCCGEKCTKEETIKRAGDPLETPKKENYYQNSVNKIKQILKFNNDTDNTCSGNIEQKPLFEMHLSSEDYDIINKDQFLNNVTKFSNIKSKKDENSTISHKKTCRCCFCLSKLRKTGAHIHVSPKGSKFGKTFAKMFNSSNSESPQISDKPCTCGSFNCSKSVKKMREANQAGKFNKRLWNPCVCGSSICKREQATMKALSPDEVTCICKEDRDRIKKKIKKKKYKAEAKRHADRVKTLYKEDSKRRKKRLKDDKRMEKRINKKASDLYLMAESAIDIGKLGITACTDILRSVARTAADPKHAYYTLKAMKDDPKLMASHLKTAFDDSDVAATARRVRLRCLAMRGVKKIKTTLEKYAITNFLLHIADSDPKKRILKKKKPERQREKFDFQCSLYMASLRKRPYLSIYKRCPWFYPHFLSLINVWKQFTDITLFLLAVVVWSPCILCMEVCRAVMCCFFCTG